MNSYELKWLPTSKIPGKIVRELGRMDCLYDGRALSNITENVFYKMLEIRPDIESLCLPYLLVKDGNVYMPNEVTPEMHYTLESVYAAFLPEQKQAVYEKIVTFARSGGQGRSQATCDAVLVVADQFILRLQNWMNFDLHSYDPRWEELQMMIDRARDCVARIWNEEN